MNCVPHMQPTIMMAMQYRGFSRAHSRHLQNMCAEIKTDWTELNGICWCARVCVKSDGRCLISVLLLLLVLILVIAIVIVVAVGNIIVVVVCHLRLPLPPLPLCCRIFHANHTDISLFHCYICIYIKYNTKKIHPYDMCALVFFDVHNCVFIICFLNEQSGR